MDHQEPKPTENPFRAKLVAEQTAEIPNQARTAMRLLADWGMSKTGANTLGELIEEIRLSEERNPAWEEIAQIPLRELGTPSQSVLEVLGEWAQELTELEQAILWGKMVPTASKKTLRELGDEHRTAYTTTWDTQESIGRKLLALMETERGTGISRKVQTIRRTIGTALREETVNDILDLRPETDPCRDLLLKLAGPYRREGNWLVLERMMDTDPTEELIKGTDQTGRVNERLFSYRLERWGLEPEKHWDWITRDGRVKEWRGKLVRWGGNLSDRTAFALDDMGRPATAQEIQEHLGENVSVRSIHVALSKDSRLVRTGPRKWGLRTWGMREYLGLVRHMREALEARGEMPVEELFETLKQDFGAKEETLRAMAAKADFQSDGATIRLRRESGPGGQNGLTED